MQTYIIIGLGNPGSEYSFTRHNFGHLAVDNLFNLWKIRPRKSKKLNCEISRTSLNGQPLVLAKTGVYVNLSGQAVTGLMNEFSAEISDILVLCDDFSIPFGKIRLRAKGSSGGHKGLQSVIDSAGSSEFARLRLGIGPVPAGLDPKDFVLGEFSCEEKKSLKTILDESVPAIEKFILR